MFFWITLKLLLFLLHLIKMDKQWIGPESVLAWAFVVASTAIMLSSFNLLANMELINISILSISVLIFCFFIVPYIIVFVILFLHEFNDIVVSPSLKYPLGRYWWFFFKPALLHKLECSLESDDQQVLKNNIDDRNYVLFDGDVYFRNKDDAVLFKLSIDG